MLPQIIYHKTNTELNNIFFYHYYKVLGWSRTCVNLSIHLHAHTLYHFSFEILLPSTLTHTYTLLKTLMVANQQISYQFFHNPHIVYQIYHKKWSSLFWKNWAEKCLLMVSQLLHNDTILPFSALSRNLNVSAHQVTRFHLLQEIVHSALDTFSSSVADLGPSLDKLLTNIVYPKASIIYKLLGSLGNTRTKYTFEILWKAHLCCIGL